MSSILFEVEKSLILTLQLFYKSHTQYVDKTGNASIVSAARPQLRTLSTLAAALKRRLAAAELDNVVTLQSTMFKLFDSYYSLVHC